MSRQTTFEDLTECIGLQASLGGNTHSSLLDGPKIDPCGLGRARANLSAKEAKERDSKTKETCGLKCSVLSKPAVRQPFSASKLFPSNGGTDQRVTLKVWVTPAGRKLNEELPNGDAESIGLPTLTAREWKDWSRGEVLASMDRGDGVAKRICNLSPTLRSSPEIVGLSPLFALWMQGYPKEWFDAALSTALETR